MRKRIIQSAAVLIGLVLLSYAAFTAKAPAPKPSEKPANQPAPKTTVNDVDKEPTEEEKLLALVPEAYRTARDLNVPAGAYISILLREGDSGFAHDFERGAKQACDDLNKMRLYKGDDKVRVTCSAPSKDSVSAQSALLDEELALYPDVLAVSITDAAASEVQFDLAMENGIYIIGFDAYPQYDGIVATVETDNTAAAAEAADKLAEAVGEGPVMIVSHDTTSSNLTARESAFIKYLGEQYPQITCEVTCHLSDLDGMREEIAAYFNDDADPDNDIKPEAATEEDLIAYYLRTHPELMGVFAADEGSAELVLDDLLEHTPENDISVTAFGSSEILKPYADDGVLKYYVEENGYGMGYATAIAAFRLTAQKGNLDKIMIGYTLQPEE